MTAVETSLGYQRLHAPDGDRTTLFEPPPADVGALVRGNVALAAARHYDFQGCSLAQVVHQARRDLLREARCWTSAYRDPPAAADDAEWIYLAGHQPEMSHPGVWYKNFALDRLARRDGAVAVNLLVDSDVLKSAALRVPGGSPATPSVRALPFDEAAPPLPYEERRIRRRELFADFGAQAAARTESLVPAPLLRQYWPLVVARARQTDNLGACLAQARHQCEGRWGLQTLEAPQSRICQSEAFAWFTAHVLAQLPRFRQVYNAAVQEYRRVNRVRSASHPAPDLSVDGPWTESPFWIWTAEEPERRALFVRPEGRRLVLTDRHRLRLEMPLTPDGDARRAVQTLLDLSNRGVKIRSRALITTLWARLVLGDVFLHGIGGAKYDQVTDALIERFFGFTPPRYLVLSATLRLPIEAQPGAGPREAAARQTLRAIEFQPERFLSAADRLAEAPSALAAAKQRWIDTPAASAETARRRYTEIRRINRALQPWADPARRQTLEQIEEARRAARAASVLSSREFAFCLFPEALLREFYSNALAQV